MFDISKYEYDFTNDRLDIDGEGMLFHCHHYNTFLQRSIQDAEYIDSKPFLIGASAECAYAQFTNMLPKFAEGERRAVIEELYRICGFGVIDMSNLTESGGEVRTKSSHHSFAWKLKFGTSEAPVAFFTSGFLAGAYAALFGKELSKVQADQTACMSMGADEDVYVLGEGASNFSIFPAKKAVDCLPVGDIDELPTGADRAAITKAITGMPLVGNSEGLLPAFGVYLTRMYGDYYNRISFEFERAMTQMAGEAGIAVSSSLFIEAGHVCAFNTFGGIMTSPEWDGLIKPMLSNKEDWAHGMVAVVNALGWGVWKTTELSEKRATFRVYNDYESVGYARMYGTAEHPMSYLFAGAAAGLMDLVYFGDVASKPTFDETFYNHLFKSPNAYKFELKQSQAQGNAYTEVEVIKP